MKAINVHELKKGMVLAKDIVASNGRLLIAKGVVLDRKQLRIINIWGITEAWIHDDGKTGKDGDSKLEINSEVLAVSKQYADRLFIGHDLNQEETAELYRLRVMDLVERVSGGWKPKPETHCDDELDAPLEIKEPESISELMGKDIDLASAPDIYFQLNEVLEDISASGEHIAEIIGRDPVISAKLLKIVNSPIYGKSGRIESLKDGVFIIGTRALSELVLCISLIERFNRIPSSIISPKQMWAHSIACGVIARVLSSYRNDLNPGRCFVAGLLHDIGKLVMLHGMPQKVKEIARITRKEHIPYYQAEQIFLNWDHSAVASELFRSWNFPAELREIVRNHHDPEKSRDLKEASVIHIADVISITWEYGNSFSPISPRISSKAWNELDLPISVLAATISKSKRQIEEMVGIFLE